MLLACIEAGASMRSGFMPDQPEDDAARDTVVPVVEEVPSLSRRTVETGRLRVEKTVSEREVVIDEPLVRQDVHVERISIGRQLSDTEELPRVRYEGETMILPVLQELPVVVKKIVLTEEIRITRVRREVRDPQTVTVMVEEVSVEHRDDDSAGTPTSDGSVD
jgi:stress response protein YsnF